MRKFTRARLQSGYCSRPEFRAYRIFRGTNDKFLPQRHCNDLPVKENDRDIARRG